MFLIFLMSIKLTTNLNWLIRSLVIESFQIEKSLPRILVHFCLFLFFLFFSFCWFQIFFFFSSRNIFKHRSNQVQVKFDFISYHHFPFVQYIHFVLKMCCLLIVDWFVAKLFFHPPLFGKNFDCNCHHKETEESMSLSSAIQSIVSSSIWRNVIQNIYRIIKLFQWVLKQIFFFLCFVFFSFFSFWD